MRVYLFLTLLLVIAVVTIFGTRGMRNARTPIEIFPDMDHQPYVKAQVPSDFFADGRAARMPVEGTINRSQPMAADYYGTGKIGDRWGTGIPIEITMKDMMRGQERFNINCAVCHGKAGHGDGIVKEYGLATIVTLQDERIRTMADGEIFNTITHGKNTMGAYGANVSVDDRWRIIAYLRALQMSQGTELAKLPKPLQARYASLEKPDAPAAEAPAEDAQPAAEAPAADAPAETPTQTAPEGEGTAPAEGEAPAAPATENAGEPDTASL